MFKNEDLFDGEAGSVNTAIEYLNTCSKACNWGVEYDIKLHDAVTEENVESSGWLDCVAITRNGKIISEYLTCTDVLNWVDGFLECMKIGVIEQ